jgi:hypothetical protein
MVYCRPAQVCRHGRVISVKLALSQTSLRVLDGLLRLLFAFHVMRLYRRRIYDSWFLLEDQIVQSRAGTLDSLGQGRNCWCASTGILICGGVPKCMIREILSLVL